MSGTTPYYEIYAYDGIPSDHPEANPAAPTRAAPTRVPACMRRCWNGCGMDEPSNFTRWERIKSIIPLVPLIVIFALSTAAALLWPLHTPAFSDLSSSWSSPPLASIIPVSVSPAAAAAAVQKTGASLESRCPQSHPRLLSAPARLVFDSYVPTADSTTLSTGLPKMYKSAWPVSVFMGVILCGKPASELPSATHRPLPSLSPAATAAVWECPKDTVECGSPGSGICYPASPTGAAVECPVTGIAIERASQEDEGENVWEWEGVRWRLNILRDGPAPLADLYSAAGGRFDTVSRPDAVTGSWDPSICLLQARSGDIDPRCGAPGSPRKVDTRFQTIALIKNPARWSNSSLSPTNDSEDNDVLTPAQLLLRDNGYPHPDSLAGPVYANNAALMALPEPVWDPRCPVTRAQALSRSRAAQRRGLAALIAVLAFMLGMLLGVLVFTIRTCRRRAKLLDHETSSRACTHLFWSYLLGVVCCVAVSAAMLGSINHLRGSVTSAANAVVAINSAYPVRELVPLDSDKVRCGAEGTAAQIKSVEGGSGFGGSDWSPRPHLHAGTPGHDLVGGDVALTAVGDWWDADGDGMDGEGTMGDAMSLLLPAIGILVGVGAWQVIVAAVRKCDVGQYF